MATYEGPIERPCAYCGGDKVLAEDTTPSPFRHCICPDGPVWEALAAADSRNPRRRPKSSSFGFRVRESQNAWRRAGFPHDRVIVIVKMYGEWQTLSLPMPRWREMIQEKFLGEVGKMVA